MKIGIDFDNTIASYDHLFARTGFDLGFLPDRFQGRKEQVKEVLFKRENGIEEWMAIQGQVYGAYMQQAIVMPGFYEFLQLCNKISRIELFIVSHKTQYGHYDKNKIDLRSASIKWLKANNLVSDRDMGIKSQNVWFEETREKKTLQSLQ